jgi:dihydroorotate dehydrogenase (fumarate)
MADLSTTYMGLKLKSPIIAGSSGLMNSLENLKQFEEAGAGAVVLKSIFEEQIQLETQKFIKSGDENAQQWNNTFQGIVNSQSHYYDEALEYINNFAKEHTLDQYLDFIREAKKNLTIPVIASIHCVSNYDWSYFAKRIQDAGADALELNVYVLPSDFNRSGVENEQVYFDIIEAVKKQVTIPISLKIGYYFSSIVNTVQKLSETGVSALVMFNRPYNPDIDINNLKLTSNYLLSNPEEYARTLRWVAILSGKLKCDIAASSGIHSFEPVVKQLLAGATVIQVASVIYIHGIDHIRQLVSGLNGWMDEHKYACISDFRGKLNQQNIENPAVYERVQFMKLYSKIE